MRTQSLRWSAVLLLFVGMTIPNAMAAITDIVISAETIRDFGEMSEQNIEIVEDDETSNGLALHWTGGANNPPIAEPTAWFKVEFLADAAEYFIWIRAKHNGDTGTDAVWAQFDDQIGTLEHTADPAAPGRGLGNWADHLEANVYDWGSQEVPPETVVSVKFKDAGVHALLMQPRQVPHHIDQIWLSQDQDERPESDPVDWDATKDPLSVDYRGKLTTTWGQLKSRQ
ncbi:hypothetical protein IH992_33825 [Candidatus Poribacteria bacterium]|nr:hypothetical protein [Candidatus Poribacteria bacterium]